MAKIDLNKSFLYYLERVKIDKNKIPPVQFTEMRRAYYAGVGDMITELGNQPEAESVAAARDVMDQITDFWVKECLGTN